MKKYLPFIVLFFLIALIPAGIYFLFPDAATNINSGDIPFTPKDENRTIETITSDYLIRLTPRHTHLTEGKQDFKMDILNRNSGSPWTGKPEAQLVLKRENAPLTLPVTVQEAGEAGQYQVEMNFTTAGSWKFTMDLKRPDDHIEIPLEVWSS